MAQVHRDELCPLHLSPTEVEATQVEFSVFELTRVAFATEGSESSNACLPENCLSSLVPLAKSCEKGIGLGCRFSYLAAAAVDT